MIVVTEVRTFKKIFQLIKLFAECFLSKINSIINLIYVYNKKFVELSLFSYIFVNFKCFSNDFKLTDIFTKNCLIDLLSEST